MTNGSTYSEAKRLKITLYGDRYLHNKTDSCPALPCNKEKPLHLGGVAHRPSFESVDRLASPSVVVVVLIGK